MPVTQQKVIKGIMTAQLNHSNQSLRIMNDSPRNVLQSMQQEEVCKVKLSASDLMNFDECDVQALVKDTLKHFYSHHETKGYKNCTCSSCQLLQYPILIKVTRDPSEYEELHKAYLTMVQIQKPDSKRQNP